MQSVRPELYERAPEAARPVWAVQWDGSTGAFAAICSLGAIFYVTKEGLTLSDEPASLRCGVNGAQGMVPVPLLHWVVKGGPDHFWPVDPDEFTMLYARKF